jgi:hypothetical protein
MFGQEGQTRKAFIGKDLDDAKKRFGENQYNPLTNKQGNSITAQEVVKLQQKHPGKHSELIKTPGQSKESFFSIAADNCERTYPGHLSFRDGQYVTPHFARQSGGGLCNKCSDCLSRKSNWNPASNLDDNQPRKRTVHSRQSFQLIRDNGQISINWHRMNLFGWPSDVNDNEQNVAKDNLRNQINELDQSLNHLQFNAPLLQKKKSVKIHPQQVPDFSISLYGFDNHMRYFFGKAERVNNTKYRWRMEERKSSGGQNDKEMTIPSNGSILIWIPSVPGPFNPQQQNWEDRCHKDTIDWIRGAISKHQRCIIEPFIYRNYPGVFLAFCGLDSTVEAPKRALLSSGDFNINMLRKHIDKRHEKQPFTQYIESSGLFKLFWPTNQNSPTNSGTDDGTPVNLQSQDGQIDLLIMADDIVDDNENWEIAVKDSKDKTHNISSVADPDEFGNIWLSLRFKQEGEHVLAIKYGSMFKKFVKIDVINTLHKSLSVYTKASGQPDWRLLSETGNICSPSLDSKRKIINDNENEILGGLNFDIDPYKKFSPNECYIGLVQDIARSVFHKWAKNQPKSIDPSLFSRKIREITYLLYWTLWPDEDINFSIPPLGVLMRRMAEFEYSPRTGQDSSWRWSDRKKCVQSIPDIDDWYILYSSKNDSETKQEFGNSCIDIDLKTGIRLIKKEAVDSFGITIVKNRPDLDTIAPSAGEWLIRLWNAARNQPTQLSPSTNVQVFRWAGPEPNSAKVMSLHSIRDKINKFNQYGDLIIDGNKWVRRGQFKSQSSIKIPTGRLFLQLNLDDQINQRGDREWKLYLGHFSIVGGTPKEDMILLTTEIGKSQLPWFPNNKLGIIGSGNDQIDLGFLKYPWNSQYLDRAYIVRETCRAFVTLSGSKRGGKTNQVGKPGILGVDYKNRFKFKYSYPETIVEALENNTRLGNLSSQDVINKMNEELFNRLWW